MKTEFILLGIGLTAILLYSNREPLIIFFKKNDLDKNENVQTEKRPDKSGVEMDSENSGSEETAGMSNYSKIAIGAAIPLAAAAGGTFYVYRKLKYSASQEFN